MSTTRDEIAAHYAHIAAVFPRFDRDACREYFELPALVTHAGGSVALTDTASFDAFFGDLMTQLREQGLTRSVPERLHLTALGPTLAVAGVLWVPYAGERVLERLGATYTLLRRAGAWRVTALVAHAPESVPAAA